MLLTATTSNSITSAIPATPDPVGEQKSEKSFINKSCQSRSQSDKNQHGDLELDHFGHSGHSGSSRGVKIRKKVLLIKVVSLGPKVTKIDMATSNSITLAIPAIPTTPDPVGERKSEKSFINKSCQSQSQSDKNRHGDLELDPFGHSGHSGSSRGVKNRKKFY
jgi:hypothetical protein